MVLAVEAMDELCRGMATMPEKWGDRKLRRRLGPWTKLSKSERFSMRLGLCIAIAKRYSLREPGCVLYEYEMEPENFQSYDDAVKTYLEIRDQQEWSLKISTITEQTEVAEQQVRETYLQQLQNVDNLERLNEKSKELLEQAAVFRTRAAELRMRTKTRRNIRRVVTGISIVVGGTSFLLLGGLEQPFLFAAESILDSVVGQGIETALGAAVAGALGYIISPGIAEAYFWSRKKVLKLSRGFGFDSRKAGAPNFDADIPDLAPTRTFDTDVSDDLGKD